MDLAGMLADADWEAHRPAVFGAAYRILGTVAEAEDVTQEIWLRAAADLSKVRDLRAWLVTLAARTSYNVLQSARVRRESYVGPWLPEPLLTWPDAAAQVLVDESVSTAMLVVMETLTPAERVALLLHDVFDFPFGRIAEVLGGTIDAPADPLPGAELHVGEVVLRVLNPTPRCVVPGLEHGPAPADRELLALLAKRYRRGLPGLGRAACFGAYAEVLHPGYLHVGQPVRESPAGNVLN